MPSPAEGYRLVIWIYGKWRTPGFWAMSSGGFAEVVELFLIEGDNGGFETEDLELLCRGDGGGRLSSP